VRGVEALSLGAMKPKSLIPQLETALKDKEGAVVMTAAKSLIQLGDEKGYAVYCAPLTGQRKSGAGSGSPLWKGVGCRNHRQELAGQGGCLRRPGPSRRSCSIARRRVRPQR
jgi:hypothetical protein